MGNSHALPRDLAQAPYDRLDPGTGEVIPVEKCAHIPFDTGASGETNTIGAPDKEGIFVVLTCRSHGGGDRVVTVSSTVNQTGNNTLTFGAAQDSIKLESIPGATVGAFLWRVAWNDGVALSTV